LIRTLCLLATLIIPAVSAQAQVSQYLARYGDTMVPVLDQTGDRSTRLFLVDRQGDTIIFKQSRRGPGTLELSVDLEGLRLRLEYPEAYNAARRAVAEGEFEDAIESLRPVFYPLFKYMDLDEEKTNFHPVMELYLDALISAEQYDEAFELIDRVDLGEMPGIIVSKAFSLAEALSDAGQSDKAIELVNDLPLSAEREEFLPRIMDFAAELRENGELDRALQLYQRVQQIPGVAVRLEAVLWSAYGNILRGRTATAEIFIDEVGEVSRDNRIFSLKKLVEGLIYLERDEPDYIRAMQQISQGVIYSDIRYNWMPELLYTAGKCYENLERPQVAREVYGQVTLFYPDSQWADKAGTAVDDLPEAEEIDRDESIVEEIEGTG